MSFSSAEAWRCRELLSSLLSAPKHLTAADFHFFNEYPNCFDVYSAPYGYPHGDVVSCIVIIRGVGLPHLPCLLRDLAREVMEEAFPVLSASWMTFRIGCSGSLIWQQHMADVPEGAYDEWRFSAWQMFNEIPDLLRRSGFVLQEMNVEPLPGPWKWKFL
jgi:hypothetical protein